MHVSETKIDVRYAETDQMGIVYHANYLVWLEIGRTNYISDLGLSYIEMEAEGILSPVVDVNISYKKPAKYGETVTVKTWVEHYDGLKTIYGYQVLNPSNEVCVEATSTHVIVKKDNFRPISLRRKFPNWHEKYESNKK